MLDPDQKSGGDLSFHCQNLKGSPSWMRTKVRTKRLVFIFNKDSTGTDSQEDSRLKQAENLE